MPIKVNPSYSYSLRWKPIDQPDHPDQEPTEEMKPFLPSALSEFGEASRTSEWKKMNEEMRAFSLVFYECVFALYVKEWVENEDFVVYFCCGKHQERGGEVVYEEPINGGWI